MVKRQNAPLSPRRINQFFALAFSLDALGRNEEAVQAYQDILAKTPDHPQACRAYFRLARLAVSLGNRTAAFEALTKALEIWPQRAVLHSELGTLFSDLNQPEAALFHYRCAIDLDPENVHAHSGAALILLRAGELEAARHHAVLGELGQVNQGTYRGQGVPLLLLIVISAKGGGAPIGRFADDRVFLRLTVVPEFLAPDAQLPPHDLVFNAIGDGDLCADALEMASQILAQTKAPILNPPAQVLLTRREVNANRLRQVPNVLTPRTAEFPRELLEPALLTAQGFSWPLLIRSPGYQLGEHFVKVDSAEELPAALATLPGTQLLVIEFIDTAGADGNFRKFRAMMIDGQVFPLHVAVSNNWKVHYFSAQMDNPQHRAEDEAFLTDMAGVIGPQRVEALRGIQRMLALDYAGIDFGLGHNGELVCFEANAMMWFDHAGEEGWAYRMAPFARVREAVREMLLRKARAK